VADEVVIMSPCGRSVVLLSGYAPALPTPFDDQDNLDRAALAHLCDCQIHEMASALVVCGTTGEAPTLSRAEHNAIIRIAVDVARGRVPVIAGAGSNCTAHAVELAKDAEAAGADAILAVVPYYNRPAQAGLYAHFQAIADQVGLPVILYDVPSRTACSLADATVARLAEHRRIIGLKDATGDLARPRRLRALVGPQFRLLSGDDATALAFLAQGGDGCISVTSNVAPGLCRNMYLAAKLGHTTRTERFAAMVAALTAALFRETNPVPVKYALSKMSLMSPRVRLPLVELNHENKSAIDAALAEACNEHSQYMIGKCDWIDQTGTSETASRVRVSAFG
jgi:4-hydroxy-tetrahydrodipicolinate synthase